MARTSGAQASPPQSLWQRVKQAGLTGLALIIPLVVTLLVLMFVWGFIASLVNPLSTVLADAMGLTSEAQRYVLLGLTTVALGVVIVIIGVVANVTSGSRLEDAFDHAIGSIPGVGAVYSSFNEMSQMLLDSDTQSFQEVVLVEYPYEGAWCVAFLTADTPGFVRETVGEEEMITVFMPMGPNPFMGGFVLHISSERVKDVDMTVEEGIRSIVTSGVAMGDEEVPEAKTALDHAAPGAAGTGGGFAAIQEEKEATDHGANGEEGS